MTFTRITRDPNVMDGQACMRGRLPVGVVLALLALGRSRESILQAFSSLEAADIDEALAYAAWRLMGPDEAHSIGEGPSVRHEQPPEVCPNCGRSSVVRVLWDSQGIVRGKDKEDVDAGRAVLGINKAPAGAPRWACMDCDPGYAEMHRLVCQDETWQVAKEIAIASRNFEEGFRLLDLQKELRPRLARLAEDLLRKSSPGESAS